MRKRFSALLMTLLFISSLLFVASPSVQGKQGLFYDSDGIRVVFDDFEFYFNASNGGEITEYFDLTTDPSRSRNLVNLGWTPYYNLLPLFSSLFYKPSCADLVFSTGGDNEARLWLVGNTSEYVILQSSSRIVDRLGKFVKDVHGNVVYLNSTWIIRHSGLVSVERTFYIPSYLRIPSGWRWYPFYLTRRTGFTDNATYYMFNTTYSYSHVLPDGSYKDKYSLYPVLPSDTNGIFGVGFPFANTSIGGDGAHNVLIAYKYDELLDVNEWRSDNYYSKKNNVTEGGAVHEFSETINVFTHTYHALFNLTHQLTDVERVKSFASYYGANTETALLMQCSVTSDKDVYEPGDSYVFYGSGVSYYNLTGLTARVTVTDGSNRVVSRRKYGPANITAGQPFNVTLLEGTVKPTPGDYAVLFQIFSRFGIQIASSNKAITVTAP